MPPTRNSRNSYRKKSHPSKRPHVKQSSQKGLIRIIAGKHRGRRLPVLVSDGLRPTGDRVKETLFNWLMMKVSQANCLDMFAGSGSLGIEALSRGAKYVLFVEQEQNVAKNIQNNLVTLREAENSQVLISSALNAELENNKPFDIVFIDPPFGKDLVSKSLEILVNNRLLASNALVYVEVGHSDTFVLPEGFEQLKQIKTSQVCAHLFEYSNNVK